MRQLLTNSKSIKYQRDSSPQNKNALNAKQDLLKIGGNQQPLIFIVGKDAL